MWSRQQPIPGHQAGHKFVNIHWTEVSQIAREDCINFLPTLHTIPTYIPYHSYFLDANFQFIHIHIYSIFIHCNMLLIYGEFIS